MTDYELQKAAIQKHKVTDPDFKPESHTCTECQTVYKSATISVYCARFDKEIAAGN